MASDYYIDLGTANTLICCSRRGLLVNEPSVISVLHGRGRASLFAIGTNAKTMLGKTPGRLSVHCPLKDGVIADFDSTAQMLRGFISRIRRGLPGHKPRLLISLPYMVTDYEREAVREVGYELGAREVTLLHEPIAAAVGLDLPIMDTRGSLVVDIGGGTTEIAVVSLGGIVNARAVRIGGTHIDDAIIRVLRKDLQFLVGQQTAERIKIAVADCLSDNAGRTTLAGGLDCVTGLPARRAISSEMIFAAVDGVLRTIVSAIRESINLCPPDIVADIQETGLAVTGGGAYLRNLQARLERELTLPIRIAENPLLSVARGGAKVLNQPEKYTALEMPT